MSAPKTRAAPAQRGQQMCVVTIEHQCFVLPSGDGLKLAALLGKAQTADPDYSLSRTHTSYRLRGQATVTWESLPPERLLQQNAARKDAP